MPLFNKHIFQIAMVALTILLHSEAIAQVLPSSADLSYLYSNSSPISLRHQLVSSDDKEWILLELNAPKVVADSLLFEFATTSSLDRPLSAFAKLETSGLRIFQSDSRQIFAIDITELDTRFVIFRVVKQATSKALTYIVELGPASNFIFVTSQLTIPDLNGYINANASLKISTYNGKTKQYGIKFYNKPFKPARPPMGDMVPLNIFEDPDTIFTTTSGSFLPTNKKGVYAIFSEDQEEYSSFLRVEDSQFPKVATVEDIINASVYLWTSDEFKKLKDSEDPKKTFDRFWLNNTNSPSRAGKAISAYFNRVKEANEKFTTFKEGWKTDMGMIYIIFGPPDKAFRTNDGFQWVYKKTYELPGFTFTFFKNSKYFTSEIYELERSTQFQNIWFRAIELWRKGRKSI
ncbi:MAG: GWxTD domain-containing protein [Cyclobacteriaceae bacterium]|nr:GWxTD domain-containing protein [Cyclobacteriaceae bacterium]